MARLLASVRLNELAAKIEVRARGERTILLARCGFLDCVRPIVPAQKQKTVPISGPIKTALFPLEMCEQCAHARAARAGR